MSTTKLKGSQIRDQALQDRHIHPDAGIKLTKLEKRVVPTDGSRPMEGHLSLANYKITDLGIAESPNDAISLGQAQQLLQSFSWKTAVSAVAVQHQNLSGLPVIDDYQTKVADRILITNNSNPAENGIYLATNTTWVRASDANTGSKISAATVLVRFGNTYKGTRWTVTNTVDVIGVDPVLWAQSADSSSNINPGKGIILDRNAFDINTGNGLVIVSDKVHVNLDPSSPLSFNNELLSLNVGTTLNSENNRLNVRVNPNGGLGISASGLRILTDESLTIVNGQLSISNNFVNSNSGLEIINGKLNVRFQFNELLTTVDNLTYKMSKVPRNGEAIIMVNGQGQKPGLNSDYTITGDTVVFTTTNAATDAVVAHYLY